MVRSNSAEQEQSPSEPSTPPVWEGDAEGDMASAAEEEEAPLEELSPARHIIAEEDFLHEARMLRDVFDARFADPRSISAERFMW